MADTQTPPNELDQIQDAPPAPRGPLNRFGRLDVAVVKRAFEPDPAGGKMRKVAFDPATHTPDMERAAAVFTITPLEARFQLIEREVLVGSKEFEITKEHLAAENLRLSEINGKYVHVAWEPDEARLGTHVGRDGQQRPSTALVVKAVFPDEAACCAAADAFFRGGRGGESFEGGASAAPPAVAGPVGADGWTDAERTERSTLLAFLPVIGAGKDYAGFVAALQADARFARYCKPDDPDVVAVLEKLGITAPAEES